MTSAMVRAILAAISSSPSTTAMRMTLKLPEGEGKRQVKVCPARRKTWAPDQDDATFAVQAERFLQFRWRWTQYRAQIT